jgi:hypothetical protein
VKHARLSTGIRTRLSTGSARDLESVGRAA